MFGEGGTKQTASREAQTAQPGPSGNASLPEVLVA